MKFPYFARICSPDDYQARVIIDILLNLRDQSGLQQYLEVGIIIVTGSYGVGGANQLINNGTLTINTYQQFLQGETELSVEVSELKKSKARVFIAIMTATIDFQSVILSAKDQDIIGDQYVWLCFDGCTTDYIFTDAYSGEIDNQFTELMAGLIGINLRISSGSMYPEVLKEWQSLDETEYPSAGANNVMSVYAQYSYDTLIFLAVALENLILANGIDINGRIISTPQFYDILLNTTYEGVTGEIALDHLGNRYPNYDIFNVIKGDTFFTNVGSWDNINTLQYIEDIRFYDGTKEIPDIDVRPPFNYWSCPDKKKEADLTGKTVHVKSPNGSNPPNIDIDYYCDDFIDCENLSDESVNCSTNYTIIFIVYGVIAGIFILFSIFFIFFTLIFGFCIPRKKVRAASPLFLLIVALSCLLGFLSIYAWYGKPQKVACGFQPWLLGLAVNSLVAALCAKTFRIWRIFKSPFDRKIITDLELVILWVVMMAPAILILFLWTLVSTPTADMVNVDGKKHFICVTGGFTGPPGGFIFFFILVGYTGILLLFGAFLSIAVRKTPSLFNESKLIGISIYNLVFLSLILIPVVIVLDTVNPFISWIIRTTGVLYAFVATLLLQFLPKLWGIWRNTHPMGVKHLSDLEASNASTFTNIPEADHD